MSPKFTLWFIPLLLLLTVAMFGVLGVTTAEDLKPNYENKTVSGICIPAVRRIKEERATGYYYILVSESDTYPVAGPEETLIGLGNLVGKRITLKGVIVHAPNDILNIYIRDLKDIIVQEFVILSGIVEKSENKKAGEPAHLFLTVGDERYELSKKAEQRLELDVGNQIEIKCYISTIDGTKTVEKINEIKRITSQPVEQKNCFIFPCDNYKSGLGKDGNFGTLISNQSGSAFAGSYHLAEDIWLKSGTPVYSVADGIVMYSDFSRTWTEESGRVHWNLGNVIVIEHGLNPPEGELDFVCSFYVHLSHDRKVNTGDRIKRGQIIGFIGADKSEENGQYPAHLHFGLHKGTYLQITPSFRRGTIEKYFDSVKKSVLSMEQEGEWAIVYIKENNEPKLYHLLMDSSKGDNKPISNWCHGYGDKDTLKEWLKSSEWLKNHQSPNNLPHK